MTGAWNLQPSVTKALHVAGWSEDRAAPLDPWVKLLEEEGYRVFDYARAVLSAFGGLVIEPAEDISATFDSGPLRIGLVPDEYDRVARWSAQLGIPLVPIGEWIDYYFVVVSSDGRVFAGSLDQLLYLGPTIEEALELVVTATRQPEEVKA